MMDENENGEVYTVTNSYIHVGCHEKAVGDLYYRGLSNKDVKQFKHSDKTNFKTCEIKQLKSCRSETVKS